ncbi:signal transduction histidine kinase [Clostridium saccharoperbutylacetonicum]|uniref:histidine kinase n=1 Tax=Clostridium saccharoperbutylacetonicum N1-4(HMT) TaxID=931276 RepID=M1LPT8_9CLOT|nr:HAMP domain-containing sensor histidine kinase [Clostridium saccharoperbutylacetonicum]AGF54880.1 signal transduction histidine kinase [Clostridium saccharoperbutylacetonicum N1-4(HMT)]NRT64415.1 signal transduction histidine kinase [Clostridium saccharoperbutylacetonicum]NSB27785.1 signal transduction histidine kinase [Clostridium saccharoperbutylacetonicum]NSB41271.1 signal transduction histidine kinase [Clostridium saccharoperbutylacetonicum]
MLRTLKGKIMTAIIFALIIFNLGLSILIYNTFYKSIKNNIKDDMENISKFSTSTLKYSSMVIEDDSKVKNKTVYEINNNYDCYVGLYDSNNKLIDCKGNVLLENSIDNILESSKGKSSVIIFNIKNGLISTYIYPVYLNGKYDSSLIIQKNYDEYYNSIKNTMTNIISAQIILFVVIIGSLNYFINRIISPLKKLSMEMKKYGEGKDVDKISVRSKDEIGQVTNSFNEMIEEKKKLENISKDFFNNATHELKTPVTSIYGYVQILEEEDLNSMDEEFKKRAVNRIMLECGKLKELIQKLLEISRCGVRKKDIKQEVKLNTLILDICDRLIDRSRRLNKKFIANIDEISILAVKEDIEHIILNLIDNALKYSKGKEIYISLKKSDADTFIFETKNKISSIPKNISENLLEPFIKYNEFDCNMEESISSSGLGLYLCNELAQKNMLTLKYNIENDEISFYLSSLN